MKQLLHEQRQLLAALDAHEAALRSCSLDRIDRAARAQDAARQRLGQAEGRRRVLIHQIGRHLRSATPPTLLSLAEQHPERKAALLKLRGELHEVAGQIGRKSSLVARVAQSVLGHVNATLRLVASAAAGPGAYTRRGDPPLPSGRLGVLNAVA